LLARVRESLGRLIVQRIGGDLPELPIATLAPTLEQMLLKVNGTEGAPGIGLEPGLADELYKQVRSVSEQQEANGEPCVLVVNPQLRPLMQRLLRSAVKGVKILSFSEIPDDWDIKIVAAVGG